MAQADAFVESPLQDGQALSSVNKVIVPRDIHFGISANPTRHWNGGDPIRTMLVDGLSIFLPEGKRFFIRSLKQYAPNIGNRDLKQDIQDFSVQEAYHTREHEDYNRAMSALGYDVEKMEAPVRMLLGSVNQPLVRLAITCAIEHMTTTIARSTLLHPEVFANAIPRYRRLWMWHALEELEHKAVALDVFKLAIGNMPRWKRYLLRISTMNSTVVPFLFLYLRSMRLYARHDGLKTGPRFWARFAYAQFVKPGLWRYSTLPFLSYYRPGFDPNKTDDSKLIEQARIWLAQNLADMDSTQQASGPAH